MTLSNQFLTLGLMIGCGGWIGLIFDIYRVLSGQLRISRWLLPLFDLFYWVFAALLVFRVLFYSNYGQLRMFVFIGLMIGFVIYFTWVSKTTIRLILWTIHLIKRVVMILQRMVDLFIITPILAFYKLILLILGFFIAFAVFLYKIMLQLSYPIRFLFKFIYHRVRNLITWSHWVTRIANHIMGMIKQLLKR